MHNDRPASTARDYARVIGALRASGDREQRMQGAADALWTELSGRAVSWLGFYLPADGDGGGTELVLGPRRDKPACSPIGLHGACGRCFRSARPMVVRDVAALGAGYITCDPRDRSEAVLPLLEPSGACWGVLDLDSHDTGAFGEADIHGLQRVMEAAGLTTPQDWRGRIDVP